MLEIWTLTLNWGMVYEGKKNVLPDSSDTLDIGASCGGGGVFGELSQQKFYQLIEQWSAAAHHQMT